MQFELRSNCPSYRGEYDTRVGGEFWQSQNSQGISRLARNARYAKMGTQRELCIVSVRKARTPQLDLVCPASARRA
jgi:hypothetical protein